MNNDRFWNCDKYMELLIAVNGDDEMKNIYVNAAHKHNENMANNACFDSGFDLFLPENTNCSSSAMNQLNLKIQCSAAMVCETGRRLNTGFYMYPRSSISKTMLRIANSVGIIDSGYRGNLIAAFDCMVPNFLVYKKDRLVQICAPGLVPIYVRIVDDLGVDEETARGDGGFGSTGR